MRYVSISAEVRVAPGGQAKVIVDGNDVGRLYHRIMDPNNGDNEVTLFLDRAAPPGEWQITVFGQDVADGRFHAWIERDAACPKCQEAKKVCAKHAKPVKL